MYGDQSEEFVCGSLKGLTSPSWPFSAFLGELNLTHISVMIWVLTKNGYNVFLNIFPVAFVITNYQVHYS